jgi:hypothetical protein
VFAANLRWSNEVVQPTVRTGSGTANLAVHGKFVSYGITGLNLSGPGDGQLQLAAAGAEGPIVVAHLFVRDSTTPASRARNSFLESDIRAAASGALPMNMEELVAQMRAGNVYVNVVTDANLQGEIRGQLTLVSEATPQSSSSSSLPSSALQIVPE